MKQIMKQNKYNKTYAVLFIIALLIAAAAPFIASSFPDGLERTAIDYGFMNHENYILSGIMPDYSIGESTSGKIAAGILGVLLTSFIFIFTGRLIINKSDPV